jgi:hypothetical protein
MNRMLLAGACLAFAAATPAGAQDSRPVAAPATRPAADSQPDTRPSTQPAETVRHDPRAVAIYQRMAAQVYRPCDNGLLDLKCHVSATRDDGGKPVEIVAFDYEWTPERERVSNLRGRPRVPPDTVRELIGSDWLAEAKRNHIVYHADDQIELRTPEWVKDRSVSHMLIHFDELGRQRSQDVYAVSGQKIQTTTYSYQKLGDEWLMTRKDHVRGPLTGSTIFEHEAVGGVTLLKKVTLRSSESPETVVTYSDLVVNSGLKIE